MSVSTQEAEPSLPALAGLLGGAILTCLFLTVLLAELGWVVHSPIPAFLLPAALAGSCLIAYGGARRSFRYPFRVTLLAAALLIGLVTASALISGAFYDVSFDGQAYHQEGVYQLAHGWNPFFQPYITPTTDDQNVKLICFPKGSWVIAAAMYRLTGRIETGKYANLLLMVAAFLLANAAFSRIVKRLNAWSVVMAALAAANPVAICQILTFYVDGQMASLLLCLLALCYLGVVEESAWVSLLLFEAAVLLIEVKFTGLVYVTLLLAGYLGFLAWKKLPIRKPLYVTFLAVGLGTCIFGINPYVFNTVRNGHPFYPFFGHGRFPKIIMTFTTPPQFLEQNRITNLGASIFSQSRAWPIESTLKAPWQVSGEEWEAFENPDVLVGGFGPLYAAALVLALGFLAWGIGRGGGVHMVAAAVMLILVASVLPVSACWWARYSPQVWLLPMVALAPFGSAEAKPLPRRLASVVLLISAVNVGGIAGVNFRANLKATHDVADSLDDLRSHAPFKVAFGYFHSNRFRLQEAGIPFIEDESRLKCDPEVEENDDLCIEPYTPSK